MSKNAVVALQVIQVYVTWMNKTLPSPNIQLIAFNRYFVLRGETVVGSFKVPLGRLAVWNDSPAGFTILKGNFVFVFYSCNKNRSF